ncbi:peptidase c45 [Holotrichia oblita]|uniref:Peptidase c45 n=1 Tax=Holotrichia oblita TaxID=644536 RepID=A0ACB9TS17_HOLOL|nr:peptidase c45 [Holotrichia oblita]
MPVKGIIRRQCIPIIYTRGTHYEVGYDIGRTFASLIQNFLEISINLNESYIPAYETIEGKKAYDDTLECVKKNFPQYVEEIQGTADGAKVPFYKLFLLHLDDITPKASGRNGYKESSGCSTVCVNQKDAVILGHTEDALSQTLNHFYIVSAHIINDQPQGRWAIKEERFSSLCYAGHLPGYTMNYNHHGLVFSVNTLSAQKLLPGKTPRHFITRALLSAENFEQAHKILRDTGNGIADGCSINMTFLDNDGDRIFHNIEMAPAYDNQESQLNIQLGNPGQNLIHCNKYLRINIPEITSFMLKSSVARLRVLESYTDPLDMKRITDMLGDQSDPKYKVFQEIGPEDKIKTIAVGIFDCIKRTWALYGDNPVSNEPLVVIPLVLKDP